VNELVLSCNKSRKSARIYDNLYVNCMHATALNEHQRQDMSDIYVFRTNIDSSSVFIHLYRELKKLSGVLDCSIDLEDCDNVLRIECVDTPGETIIEVIEMHGFFCEELSY